MYAVRKPLLQHYYMWKIIINLCIELIEAVSKPYAATPVLITKTNNMYESKREEHGGARHPHLFFENFLYSKISWMF